MSSESKPQNSLSPMPSVGTPKTPRASAASVASRRRCLLASLAGSTRGASCAASAADALRVLGVGATAPHVAQDLLADEAARRAVLGRGRPGQARQGERVERMALSACRAGCRRDARASAPGGNVQARFGSISAGPLCARAFSSAPKTIGRYATVYERPTNASGSRSNARYAYGETGSNQKSTCVMARWRSPAEFGDASTSRRSRSARRAGRRFQTARLAALSQAAPGGDLVDRAQAARAPAGRRVDRAHVRAGARDLGRHRR